MKPISLVTSLINKGADLATAMNVQCGLRSVYSKVFSWNRLFGFARFVIYDLNDFLFKQYFIM